MKKVLFVATVAHAHICVFHIPFLKMLKEQGYETYVAAHNDYLGDNADIPYCDYYYDLPFERSPFKVRNIKAYKELKKLIDNNEFDIIHCHTPVGGIIGRLAARKARKKGTKVMYTAHGFHFYRGAPLKNWLLYYPAEKICARMTDVLITINREDYALAQKKMKAKRIEYIPGIGVDTSKFSNVTIDKYQKRASINIPQDAFLLLSVGELNKNKNHETVIRALASLKDENIHYCIAGRGSLQSYLEELAKKLGVETQVHMLGFRTDIAELLHIADVFVFPSLREGLGLAAVEAMSAALPLILSDNRGSRDYAEHGVNALICNATDVTDFENSINMLLKDGSARELMSSNNIRRALDFDINKVCNKMNNIYAGRET